MSVKRVTNVKNNRCFFLFIYFKLQNSLFLNVSLKIIFLFQNLMFENVKKCLNDSFVKIAMLNLVFEIGK